MELVAPAKDSENLAIAYAYGADAAYIGVQGFSLRSRAELGTENEIESLKRAKKGRNLYGAINAYLHEDDIKLLSRRLDAIGFYPFDAFIVSDMGAAMMLRERFPDVPLHLSTQANCLNSAAVRAYARLGFSRIILGRETPLKDIARIKDAAPDVFIETFVHGSMCMAYSGRCLISGYLASRSANSGDCAQSCRWKYRLMALEEEQRPGSYYPIYEEDGYTTILSAKDLCMIDYLGALRDANVDAIKIEGRMKSAYYVAMVTRAYRKALDALQGAPDAADWQAYRDDLVHVSHREYSTGLYFESERRSAPSLHGPASDYLFVGMVTEHMGGNLFRIALKNTLVCPSAIEFIGPHTLAIFDDEFLLYNSSLLSIEQANAGECIYLWTNKPIDVFFFIRRKM